MGTRKLILLVLLSLLLPGCSMFTSTNQQEIKVIKFSEVHPDGSPNAEATKYFAKLLKERSNGKIQLDVYTGGQLGDEKTVEEAIKSGIVDMNRLGITKIIPATNLPFIFRDANHMWQALNGPLLQDIVAFFDKNERVFLGLYDSGARSFYATKPIIGPQDFVGTSVRVAPMVTQEPQRMVQALGGNPLDITYNDVYLGFQTGKITVAENNPPSYVTSKHYELAPYLVLDEHGISAEAMFITKQAWALMSADEQKLFKECATEAIEYQHKLWNEFTEKSLKELETKGVKITKPDKEQFRKAMVPMYDQYPQYKEVIQKIQAVK